MFKLDKRGAWFFEETAKIIFSVIIIVFIVWFTVSLIMILKSDTELEQAEATLKEIERVVSKMEPGDVETVLIESPRGGWHLIVDKEDSSSLCMYNSTEIRNEGLCRKLSVEVILDPAYATYKNYEESKIDIPNFDNLVSGSQLVAESIYLDPLPKVLYLTKTASTIQIESHTQEEIRKFYEDLEQVLQGHSA